jgi:hypothetical protein
LALACAILAGCFGGDAEQVGAKVGHPVAVVRPRFGRRPLDQLDFLGDVRKPEVERGLRIVMRVQHR